MLALLLSVILYLVHLVRLRGGRELPGYCQTACSYGGTVCSRRKPERVRREVIRLKALMRRAGTCRAIEALFNRRFAVRRRMTVGRTWVSEVIRDHRYEIEIVRRQIKNAKPRPLPKKSRLGHRPHRQDHA